MHEQAYDRIRDCCWRGEPQKVQGERVILCERFQANELKYRCPFHGNKKAQTCRHFLLILGVAGRKSENCTKCGLPPDLCICKDIAKEKRRRERLKK